MVLELKMIGVGQGISPGLEEALGEWGVLVEQEAPTLTEGPLLVTLSAAREPETVGQLQASDISQRIVTG